MENNKVYILHQGEYSDQVVVGVFSSKEKMDKYISDNLNLSAAYNKDYWYEDMIIDDLDNNEEHEYHNYLTKFNYRYDIYSGLSVNINSNNINNDISIEINKPCECKIYYDNSNFLKHGYIITPKKYSEEKIRKIIQDKIYKRLCERNLKLEKVEIL